MSSRPLAIIADDLESLHERCERICATLGGLGLLFAALSALTVFGGIWTREPLFVMSAGFALTASAAFGLSAQSLARAAAQTPRIRAELIAAPVKTWRRAA